MLLTISLNCSIVQRESLVVVVKYPPFQELSAFLLSLHQILTGNFHASFNEPTVSKFIWHFTLSFFFHFSVRLVVEWNQTQMGRVTPCETSGYMLQKGLVSQQPQLVLYFLLCVIEYIRLCKPISWIFIICLISLHSYLSCAGRSKWHTSVHRPTHLYMNMH